MADRSAALGRVIEEDLDRVVARAAAGLRRLAGKTVLVTGAAGFLLSFVVDALVHANDTLLEEPCRVVGVDNMIVSDARRTSHLAGRPDVVFLEANVVDGVPFADKVDYVVLLACTAVLISSAAFFGRPSFLLRRQSRAALPG